jgi:hypothetical protein
MTLDDFIQFITERDPAAATPESIAKLFPHVSAIKKFADAVSDCAEQLAKSDSLPGYALGKGRAKPLQWVEGFTNPTWMETKQLSPAQVIKNNLASEAVLTKQGWAVRPESELVPVPIAAERSREAVTVTKSAPLGGRYRPNEEVPF